MTVKTDFFGKKIKDAICINSREFPPGILLRQIPGYTRTGIPGGLAMPS